MKAKLLIVLLLAVATFYVLEQYVLIGKVLVNASATISDMNPSPAVSIVVPNAGDEVTVYLKAKDVTVSYSVIAPTEEVVLERQVALGRHNFSFEAEQSGTYVLRLENEDNEGTVVVSAWANDKRLFYGLHF